MGDGVVVVREGTMSEDFDRLHVCRRLLNVANRPSFRVVGWPFPSKKDGKDIVDELFVESLLNKSVVTSRTKIPMI